MEAGKNKTIEHKIPEEIRLTLQVRVKKSLNIWESKVHEYGLIMGHNYNHGDIARAVGEYFNEVWVLPDNVWAGAKVWLRDDRKNFDR